MTEIALALALAGAVSAPERLGPSPKPPPVPREFRGVWVATVSNIDWPSSRTLTPAQQRQQAIAILDRAVELRLNAIVLQVRPACDALYSSAIEPWSEYLTNVMGTAPNPLYDPLHFWVAEAHARGLELHAWFNPFRALASSHRNAIASNHVSITKPHLVKDYGDAKWLDPGFHESREHSLNVILDVLNRYDVDGIHFDDYFYPYPISGVAFPDDDSYGAYLSSGGTLSRADWRRWNIDTFVSTVYQAIKAAKPTVKFGISPFGIWRPGNPPGVTGLDAYNAIYADSRKWLQQGWVDYMTPQLYWRMGSTGQPYQPLLTWWTEQNLLGRHVWPGNFTSNVGSQFGDWPVYEIAAQIETTRSVPGATGNVHFSMRAFRDDYKGIVATLRDGVYSYGALPPATPWLDLKPPRMPSMTVQQNAGDWTLQFADPGGEAALWLVVHALYGGQWVHEILPAGRSEVVVPLTRNGAPLAQVRVERVDRSGNASEGAVFPSRTRH